MPTDHPAWEEVAETLAYGVINVILTLSPKRIILGGGVMSNASLYPRIRRAFSATLADYLQAPAVRDANAYIAPPALGDNAGVIGAMLLAMNAG